MVFSVTFSRLWYEKIFSTMFLSIHSLGSHQKFSFNTVSIPQLWGNTFWLFITVFLGFSLFDFPNQFSVDKCWNIRHLYLSCFVETIVTNYPRMNFKKFIALLSAARTECIDFFANQKKWRVQPKPSKKLSWSTKF